jgi:hypothetical protein
VSKQQEVSKQLEDVSKKEVSKQLEDVSKKEVSKQVVFTHSPLG